VGAKVPKGECHKDEVRGFKSTTNGGIYTLVLGGGRRVSIPRDIIPIRMSLRRSLEGKT